MRTNETAIALDPPSDAVPRFTGVIRTPWTGREDCPRQGRDDGRECRIVLDPVWHEALEVVLMGRTARLGMFAQPGWQDHTAARNAMGRVGERLGIGDLAERDYSRLSGGQRHLVLIARSLAEDAPLIVMDVPAASHDFGNQAQVLAQIGTLVRNASVEERGVILSTHDPDQAFALTR